MRGDLVPRWAREPILDALRDTRVVVIAGARQVGKSTLALQIVERLGGITLTLDDPAVLEAARRDPVSFVEHDGLLMIDEVQRAPELLLPIKAAVDRDQRPGRFLLTGSADILAIPKIAGALTGRMEVVHLSPFTQGELEGRRDGFVDAVLSDSPPPAPRRVLRRREYLDRAVRGGYPEAVRRDDSSRERWFESYVDSLVHRDVRELADVQRLDEFPRLLRLIAARSASRLNVDALARDAAVPPATLRRYLAVLHASFVVASLPAWSDNRTTRATRSRRIFIADSGLASYLTGASVRALEHPVANPGPIVETFAIMEIRRQVSWSRERPEVHALRTRDGVEVDAVLETRDGRIAGIEIKASSSARFADFSGLRYLASRVGERFVRGVVLYAGQETLSLGDRYLAMPLNTLWS